MARDLKYGEIEISGIALGEPIFILRAKDAAAVSALAAYSVTCEALGSPESHVAGVKEAAHAFEAWQTRHDTKVPD